MLKLKAEFEVVVNDKTGRFIVDQDTETGAAKEMVFQFQKMIGQIEDNIKAKQDAKKAEDDAKEASDSKVEAIQETKSAEG